MLVPEGYPRIKNVPGFLIRLSAPGCGVGALPDRGALSMSFPQDKPHARRFRATFQLHSPFIDVSFLEYPARRLLVRRRERALAINRGFAGLNEQATVVLCHVEISRPRLARWPLDSALSLERDVLCEPAEIDR